jgi:hypothetical protein
MPCPYKRRGRCVLVAERLSGSVPLSTGKKFLKWEKNAKISL